MPKQLKDMNYGLCDSALFKICTRKKLAKILLTTTSQVSELVAKDELYVRRWKHKKKEQWLRQPPNADEELDYRPIDIPDPHLKIFQARIAKLLRLVTPPDFLFSPVKGRSYVDNAARHKGARAFWQLDIADYFPSCTANSELLPICWTDLTVI